MAISYPADGNAVCFLVEDDSFWFRHRNRCIVEAVTQFPPSGQILDIGGGNGWVARGLIDAGFRTALLEPGAEGAANARTHRRIPEVINAPLEEANLAKASLPAAGLFDVLEHIEDDAGFLAKVANLLQPGGYLYLTVPAHRWLWSLADVDAGHFRRYTAEGLRTHFERAGFDVQYLTYFFEALVLPVLLLRTLPYAVGLARRADPRMEHTGGSEKVSSRVERLLKREINVISKRRTLTTGTSCLLVARKSVSLPRGAATRENS
jgi:SAM-dependent methyltransferase